MASVGDEAPVDLQPPTFDDVKAAADRIRGMANHTPVVTSRTVDEMASTGQSVLLPLFISWCLDVARSNPCLD